MDKQLLFICSLTFVIHLIGTLAYSARIVGVRARHIAVSFALFSILTLVSRTSNSFLGPFGARGSASRARGGEEASAPGRLDRTGQAASTAAPAR
jgi:hypothetical protein